MINTLLCPSAGMSQRMDKAGTIIFWVTGTQIDGWVAATSDYQVNDSIESTVIPAFADPGPLESPWPGTIKGILYTNKLRRIAEVSDGLSNTFLISEDAGRPDRYIRGRSRPDLGRVVGAGWADFENSYSTGGSPSVGGDPGDPSCHTNCDNGHEDYAFHPGGTQKLYTDGSVRFIKGSVSMRIFARLMSYNLGEVISADSF